MAKNPSGVPQAKMPGAKHEDPSGPEGHHAHVNHAIKHAEKHGTTAHYHEEAEAHETGFPHMGKGKAPGKEY